jgi:hypothetical protein
MLAVAVVGGVMVMSGVMVKSSVMVMVMGWWVALLW